MSLVERVQGWGERYNALSRKERCLILLATLLVLAVAWAHWFWSPLGLRQQRLEREKGRLTQQSAELQSSLAALAATSPDAVNQELARQRDDLLRRIDAENQRMAAMTASLVTPAEMPAILASLLATVPDLKLVRMANLPVEPLLKIDAAKEPAVDPATTAPNLYRHGLELVFEGSYAATLSYLKQSERLNGRLFWGDLHYQVDTYPKGVAQLRVYTFSLSPNVVGL